MAKRKNALQEPKKLSKDLEAIVGKGPMARTQVTKKLWEYIKKFKCQNPKNPREIVPDSKLQAVLGKNPISMFKMPGAVGKHIG